MPTITPSDGTEIFYTDWGSGEPIRVIAHDRRGHGRSTQAGGGEVVRFIGRHGETRVSRAVRPRGPRLAA